ncbi:MAG: hypothetical protein MJ158_03110 [Alphaproteobacteria bacterium]|nr:hypothetical protein [Alphaproteobacteria bacterium]
MLQKQAGNFLLQALLALSLVFTFVPFLTGRLINRDMTAQMFAVTEQIETIHNVSRIYLTENKDNLEYNKIVLSGDDLIDTLENYGLPFGSVPVTSFKQNISLVINNTPENLVAFLQIDSGSLSKIQLSELARRIGFYASVVDGNIEVSVPHDIAYTDIVYKKELKDSVGFLSNLNMDKNSINKIGALYARNGEIEMARFGTLSVSGYENGRSEKNEIENIFAGKTFFQSSDGTASLSLNRGVLSVGSLSTRTVSKFGANCGLVTEVAGVYDFSMAEGKKSFTGPYNWTVHGDVKADKINFSVERLDISSMLNASLGQDAYITSDDVEYSSYTGIETDTISASNITLRDQTSYGLLNGSTGAVVLDIRPAGTSVLPDVYVDTIDNDSLQIIADAKDTDGNIITCKDIITQLDGNYNKRSLAQNIICQYVFWQRLENRINIKQCLMAGKNDCL